MFTVYVLKSEVIQKGYVGMTDDLTRRLKEHNSGRNTYTMRHLPWVVIYTEEFETLEMARERERCLKTAAGRRFLKRFFPSN